MRLEKRTWRERQCDCSSEQPLGQETSDLSRCGPGPPGKNYGHPVTRGGGRCEGVAKRPKRLLEAGLNKT